MFISHHLQLQPQLQNRTSSGKSKRRHLGWHPRAQFKPNPEPYVSSVYKVHKTSKPTDEQSLF